MTQALSALATDPGWGSDFYVKVTGILAVSLAREKAVLASLRVLSLKKSTAGAFAVPFRLLKQAKT